MGLRSNCARRGATAWPAVLLAAVMAGAPAHAQPPEGPAAPPSEPQPDPFEQAPPRDPDDAPYLAAPYNQLGQWSAGRRPPLTRGFDDDHLIQLTAVPTYAAFRGASFLGRGTGPFRGGGIGIELDLRVVRWLFLRAQLSHTLHPVFERSSFDEDSEEVTTVANGGLLQATHTGASVVYALDIGRFVTRADAGAGLMFVRSPDAAQDGQWGGACRGDGSCDFGLSCSAEDRCRPTPVPTVHIGLGVDVLFGRRWALGLQFRYYALLSAIADLPVYLMGNLRLSLRF